jgi:hypothetical protein
VRKQNGKAYKCKPEKQIADEHSRDLTVDGKVMFGLKFRVLTLFSRLVIRASGKLSASELFIELNSSGHMNGEGGGGNF